EPELPYQMLPELVHHLFLLLVAPAGRLEELLVELVLLRDDVLPRGDHDRAVEDLGRALVVPAFRAGVLDRGSADGGEPHAPEVPEEGVGAVDGPQVQGRLGNPD